MAKNMQSSNCVSQISTSRHAMNDPIYTGTLCDNCRAPMAYDDGVCDDCRMRQLEYEQDEAWPVYLASLRYGAAQIEKISNALDNLWQYIGGDVRREKHSKGVSVASANHLQLTKAGASIVFSHQAGVPFVTVYKGNAAYNYWSAMFTSEAPIPLILAAADAAV